MFHCGRMHCAPVLRSYALQSPELETVMGIGELYRNSWLFLFIVLVAWSASHINSYLNFCLTFACCFHHIDPPNNSLGCVLTIDKDGSILTRTSGWTLQLSSSEEKRNKLKGPLWIGEGRQLNWRKFISYQPSAVLLLGLRRFFVFCLHRYIYTNYMYMLLQSVAACYIYLYEI